MDKTKTFFYEEITEGGQWNVGSHDIHGNEVWLFECNDPQSAQILVDDLNAVVYE